MAEAPVEGVVGMISLTSVRAAEPRGSGARLLLDGPSLSNLDIDHVIAGTGFRIDLSRMTYLPADLRARVATHGGYPILTWAGESTVPGLYFVGAPAAFGLGPSMRFIAGTHNVAGQVARSVSRRTKRTGGASVPFGHGDKRWRSNDKAALQLSHSPTGSRAAV